MPNGEWLQRNAFACNYNGLEKIHDHVRQAIYLANRGLLQSLFLKAGAHRLVQGHGPTTSQVVLHGLKHSNCQPHRVVEDRTSLRLASPRIWEYRRKHPEIFGRIGGTSALCQKRTLRSQSATDADVYLDADVYPDLLAICLRHERV